MDLAFTGSAIGFHRVRNPNVCVFEASTLCERNVLDRVVSSSRLSAGARAAAELKNQLFGTHLTRPAIGHVTFPNESNNTRQCGVSSYCWRCPNGMISFVGT